MMLHFLEDYIELLYGSIGVDGQPVTLRTYQQPATPVKLASYDRSPVATMGAYCAKARITKMPECLTDKQAVLARTIVGKYRRQLNELGITMFNDVNNISLRHQIRAIDRTQALIADVGNKKFILKFPYSPQKISALHNFTSNSAGKVEWSNTARNWTFDLTEGNLRTALDLFKEEDLKIDDDLVSAVEDVMRANSSQLPSVHYENNQLVLLNCHLGLIEYLENRGFESANPATINKWVSVIAHLGIEIHDSVIQHLTDRFGYDVARIICQSESIMPSGNQPTGPWHETLLKTNYAMADVHWVLYLDWWSEKTDWSAFKNIEHIKSKKKTYNTIEPRLLEQLTNNAEPIVVMDSVVGGDAVRDFIEHKALKVIYISDIGPR